MVLSDPPGPGGPGRPGLSGPAADPPEDRRALRHGGRAGQLGRPEVLRLGSFFADKQAIFHNLLVELVGYFRPCPRLKTNQLHPSDTAVRCV